MPCPDQNSPWRGQISKAQRAVAHVRDLQRSLEHGRFESGMSDHGHFLGVSVHVPTLKMALWRREVWHKAWLAYGRSLRSLPPR